MKVLFLNYSYYMYPDGITSLEQFVEYANKHFNEFIKLTELCTDNCCPPYFVKEDVKTVYKNLSNVEEISEYEIKEILPKTEYDERLKKIVAEKCVHCKNYEEETGDDNLRGHRNQISLDGECWRFSTVKN